MSNAVPQVRSTPILALVFLMLSFASGLFLAHGSGKATQSDVTFPMQPGDSVESADVDINWQARLASMDVQLSQTRAGILGIHEELAILREQQTRIDLQVAALAERIREAAFSKTQASPRPSERQANERAGSDED
jgi:hypothetical protein